MKQHDSLEAIIMSRVSDLSPELILDLGCGAGQFIGMLTECVSDYRKAVGVDPDKDSLDEARRSYADWRTSFMQRDAARLPFADHKADIISISNALHHIPEPHAALAEARRVLSRDGLLIIHEMCDADYPPAQALWRDAHHLKADIDSVKGLSHRHTYIREDILSLVRDAGFQVDDVHDYSPDPPEHNHWPDVLRDYLGFVKDSPESQDLQQQISEVLDRMATLHAGDQEVTPPRHVVIFGVR